MADIGTCFGAMRALALWAASTLLFWWQAFMQAGVCRQAGALWHWNESPCPFDDALKRALLACGIPQLL
eukprot:1158274-Pelagomonas_calceolata.AAC.55